MINPLDMSGKTVLVTGASSGLGRDTAILLSALGARVVLLARDQRRLELTRASLDGGNHPVVPFDLAQGDGIPGLLLKCAEETGPLHGLVHCAGVAPVCPLRAVNVAHIQNVMQVNVVSAIMLAKGFRQKGVCARDSSIVFMSSVMGLVGEKARAAYCASKGGIESLTKALALELAPEHIRVNCVAPALVKTEMHGALAEQLTGGQLSLLEAKTPLGLGQPRDVSHAVAFLLSDASRWITGSSIVVDGGYCAQ